MSCCPDKTYSSCNNYEYTPKSYNNDPLTPFISTPLAREYPVSVYVSQPSVIQVTFSGTATGDDESSYGDVGFQLSMYNVLGGVVAASSVTHFPVGTLTGTQSISMSTTYAWNVCAGTYAINVTVTQLNGGTYASLKAGGDLCVVTTRK